MNDYIPLADIALLNSTIIFTLHGEQLVNKKTFIIKSYISGKNFKIRDNYTEMKN